MTALIDLQIASDNQTIPTLESFQLWLDTALQHVDKLAQEVTIRIVDESESQTLNHTYREKNQPTNVLSFPFEAPVEVDIAFLGDMVICAPVVEKEAEQQRKHCEHHWAHMTVHGALHLMGFDHIEEADAEVMESTEIAILSKLGIDDPYQDH